MTTCRCGFTGDGVHLCHRCGKKEGTSKFIAYPTCLAGVQSKLGAYETFGCDDCWKQYKEQVK